MRPFSCKSFFLCPSCAQKRALILGEYLSGNLLLNLPHRQFVWTIPKVLRSFLRHDRNLFADIGRLIFDILSSYFGQAAGRPICGAMVSRYGCIPPAAVEPGMTAPPWPRVPPRTGTVGRPHSLLPRENPPRFMQQAPVTAGRHGRASWP
jgi:hypothetical protein